MFLFNAKKGKFSGSKKQRKAAKKSCTHFYYDKNGRVRSGLFTFDESDKRELIDSHNLSERIIAQDVCGCALCGDVLMANPLPFDEADIVFNDVNAVINFLLYVTVPKTKDAQKIKDMIMARQYVKEMKSLYGKSMTKKKFLNQFELSDGNQKSDITTGWASIDRK